MINKKNVGLFLMLTVVNYIYVMDEYPPQLSEESKKKNTEKETTQTNSEEKVVIRKSDNDIELMREHRPSSLGINEIYLLEAAERQGERKIAWEEVVRRFISQ